MLINILCIWLPSLCLTSLLFDWYSKLTFHLNYLYPFPVSELAPGEPQSSPFRFLFMGTQNNYMFQWPLQSGGAYATRLWPMGRSGIHHLQAWPQNSWLVVSLNLSFHGDFRGPAFKVAAQQGGSDLDSWVISWREPTKESCPTCTWLWHEWEINFTMLNRWDLLQQQALNTLITYLPSQYCLIQFSKMTVLHSPLKMSIPSVWLMT